MIIIIIITIVVFTMAEREREKKKQSKTAEAADYHFRQSIDYRIKFNTKKTNTQDSSIQNWTHHFQSIQID